MNKNHLRNFTNLERILKNTHEDYKMKVYDFLIILVSVISFLVTMYKNMPEPSMKNYLDALEGPPESVLATVTSALPRIAAQGTLAMAYLIAKEDMQPLIVTFQNGNFGLLNMAKTAPKWIAVDAGKKPVRRQESS
jgi:hypothetical protein